MLYSAPVGIPYECASCEFTQLAIVKQPRCDILVDNLEERVWLLLGPGRQLSASSFCYDRLRRIPRSQIHKVFRNGKGTPHMACNQGGLRQLNIFSPDFEI